MNKKEVIRRHSINLKNLVGTGLAQDECEDIIKYAVNEALNLLNTKKYTIQELKHLRNIRAVGFDDSFADDEYGTEKDFFKSETEKLFDWIEKMERRNKIKDMLATMNVAQHITDKTS